MSDGVTVRGDVPTEIAEGTRPPGRPGRSPLDIVVLGLVAVSAVMSVVSIGDVAKGQALYSQWLITYDQGLVKRGLLGTVLTSVFFPGDGQISLGSLYRISFATAAIALALAMLVVLRVWWACRASWTDRAGEGSGREAASFLVASALLIATPIGYLYYLSNNSYYEVVNLGLLALFVNVVLFRPSRTVGFAVLVVVSLVSLLVHENSLLSTIPVMVVLTWLVCEAGSWDRKVLAKLGLVLVASGVITVALGPSSVDAGPSLVSSMSTRYELPAADWQETEDVLTRSVPDNVRYAFDKYQSKTGGGSRIIFSLLVTVPAMAFLVSAARRRLDRDRQLPVIGATFLPMLLVFLADDVYRWFIFTVIGLAFVTIVLERFPDAGRAAPVDGADAEEAVAAPASSSDQISVLALGMVVILIACLVPYPSFLGYGTNPLSDPVFSFLSNTKQLLTGG